MLLNGVLRCGRGESLVARVLPAFPASRVTVHEVRLFSEKNEGQEGWSLSSTIHEHGFEGVSRKEDLKAFILNGDVLH